MLGNGLMNRSDTVLHHKERDAQAEQQQDGKGREAPALRAEPEQKRHLKRQDKQAERDHQTDLRPTQGEPGQQPCRVQAHQHGGRQQGK